MSEARLRITDDQGQRALTGQTAQQAIDGINVDTLYTHLAAASSGRYRRISRIRLFKKKLQSGLETRVP